VVQFKASFSAGPVRRKPTPSAQPQQLFTWHECVTPNSSKEVRRDLRMAAMVFHCRLPGGSSVLRDVFFWDLYAGKIKQSQTHWWLVCFPLDGFLKRATPKSSILIGFTIINQTFCHTPIYGPQINGWYHPALAVPWLSESSRCPTWRCYPAAQPRKTVDPSGLSFHPRWGGEKPALAVAGVAFGEQNVQ